MIHGISDGKFQPNPKNPPIKLKRNSVEWRKLVQSVFQRDGFRCAFCKKIFPSNELSPCHIKSVGSGGNDSADNLKTGCKNCHLKDHNGEFVKDAVKTYARF